MDPYAVPDNAVLLPDTIIYIDGLKRAGLPAAIQALLASHKIHHSPICVGELAFGYGGLDPARNLAAITGILDRPATEFFVEPQSGRVGRGRSDTDSAHPAPRNT